MNDVTLICIHFTGDENNAEELRSHIMTAYPKLGDCGGFELLRMSGMTRSRNLAVIPCPNTGYTVRALKAHVGHAIIYIRPMQKAIDKSCKYCISIWVHNILICCDKL